MQWNTITVFTATVLFKKLAFTITILYQKISPTNYLRDSFDVQIQTFWKYREKKGFAYVKVPRHLSVKLLKLHGIGFKGKMLVIGKAKTPAKAKNINGVNQNVFSQTQPLTIRL